MSTLHDKLNLLCLKQNEIKRLETDLKVAQGKYQETLNDILQRELGYSETDQIPLAELVKRAVEKAV